MVGVVAEVVPNLTSGLMAGGPLFAGVNMGRGGATEVCGLGLEGRGKEPSGVASLKLLAVAVEHSVLWAASWSAARVTVRSMARPSAEAVRYDDKEVAVAEVPIGAERPGTPG